MTTTSPDLPPGMALLDGYGRGAGWTYLSLGVTGGSTFLLTAWSLRRIGTAEYGLFAIVTALTNVFLTFDYALGLGVQRAGARVRSALDDTESQENRDRVRAAHCTFAVLGLAIVGVAALVAVVILAVGTARRPYVLETVLLLGFAMALQMGTAALPAVTLATRQVPLRSCAAIAGIVTRVVIALLMVPRFGVAGLGLAQVGGVAADRLVLIRFLSQRLPWFEMRPTVPNRSELRQVANFAAPLLGIGVSQQLLVACDVVVVGIVSGASAVAVYQVASIVPLYAVGILTVGYNVILPALAGSNDLADQEDATAFLTRLFCYVAGVGFVLVALFRRDLIDLLLGRRSHLAENILIIACGIALARIALHGLVLVLIARGRQVLMVRTLAAEVPLNVILTVALVVAWGPVGASTATLATVLLLNSLIFPLAARHEFRDAVAMTLLRHGALPATLGAGVALLAAGASTRLQGTPLQGLALTALFAFVIGGIVGALVVGRPGRAALRDVFAAAGRHNEGPS